MSLLANSSVIISQIILSLYPILIKVIPTNFDTQLLSRFAVFTFASLAFYSGQSIQLGKLFLYGFITIFHVVTSYIAFSNLSAGTAMALFYTYPLMNVIAGIILFGESISFQSIIFLLLGFIGTVLLSQEIPNEDVKGENPIKIPQTMAIWAGLLAAFSETLVYLIIRNNNTSNPIDSMLQLYPGALLIFGVYLLITQRIQSIDLNPKNLTNLCMFNLIIGFAGYCLRFYSIHNVSTIVFSLLSFIGVLSSYMFGKYFVGETSSWKTYLGALFIAVSSSGIVFT
jgi:drug/metabolite transporter (DMT)-like permease